MKAIAILITLGVVSAYPHHHHRDEFQEEGRSGFGNGEMNPGFGRSGGEFGGMDGFNTGFSGQGGMNRGFGNRNFDSGFGRTGSGFRERGEQGFPGRNGEFGGMDRQNGFDNSRGGMNGGFENGEFSGRNNGGQGGFGEFGSTNGQSGRGSGFGGSSGSQGGLGGKNNLIFEKKSI